MKFNLTDFILKKHTRSDHLALILVDDVGMDRKITYHRLHHDVCCLINGISTLKLPAQAVIGVQADDVYDLLLLFLASIAAGLVPIPLLLSLSDEEMEFTLQNSRANATPSAKNSGAKRKIPSGKR